MVNSAKVYYLLTVKIFSTKHNDLIPISVGIETEIGSPTRAILQQVLDNGIFFTISFFKLFDDFLQIFLQYTIKFS